MNILLTLASQTKSLPIELVAGESDIAMVGSCSSIVTSTLLSSQYTREEMYTPLEREREGGSERERDCVRGERGRNSDMDDEIDIYGH